MCKAKWKGNEVWSVAECCSVVMVLVIRCQTLEDLWRIWSCFLYVLYDYYHNIFFINVYMVLFVFNNVIYAFLLYDYVFSVYVYVWLPWLRFVRAFSSVVRQMPGYNPQRRGTAHTLPSCCVALCIFCVVLCTVCFVAFPYCLCVYVY
jgi:hypothetical protein